MSVFVLLVDGVDTEVKSIVLVWYDLVLLGIGIQIHF